jgi:hypothetical protein
MPFDGIQASVVLATGSQALVTTYAAGYKHSIPLHGGGDNDYYVEDVWHTTATNVAASTTNTLMLYLRDADGNAIASFAAGSAMTATKAPWTFASTDYRTIAAGSADTYLYVDWTNSGTSQAPVGLAVHVLLSRRRAAD